jgi:hypothetical protein
MRLPSGTDARLGFFPGKRGPYFVFVAGPPNTAGMHLLDMVFAPG